MQAADDSLIMLTCCRLKQCTVSKEDSEHELCLKIQAQLEELFSDSHLAEDGFLLKHIQKDKEGFVSLKLLTCLKKVTMHFFKKLFML